MSSLYNLTFAIIVLHSEAALSRLFPKPLHITCLGPHY
jgi:hypothetical protein